jgi:hypothetical protein
MQQQPRLTDLVPRALWLHGLLGLLGAGAIAGLLLAHPTDGAGIGTFDLGAPGSLARWFASAALLVAAALSVIVYSVRRHKTDDYHGRYHIWLWAAMCWVLVSADATASLRLWFQQTMIHLTGTRVLDDGSLWWIVPSAVILGGLGSRLLLDMRPARLSSTMLLGSGTCFLLAMMDRMAWLRLTDHPGQAMMLSAGTWLAAVWLLTLATALHARYVILDAEGLIPLPQPKPADEDQQIDAQRDARLLRLAETSDDEEDEDDEEQWLAVDQPEQSPQPVLRRRSVANEEPAETDVEPIAPVSRKLTKQEKKALKRRLMRQQAERQRDAQRKWAS